MGSLEKGRTIVWITHEEEVAAHSKRRLVLVDGQIVVDERAAGVGDPPPLYRPRNESSIEQVVS